MAHFLNLPTQEEKSGHLKMRENSMPKIMIIDNNLTFGQMLADTLETTFSACVMNLSAGCSDLLGRFRLFSPDIVFIDVQSLGATCFGLTKIFKASRLALRVIWFTSCDQPEYSKKAQDSGVDYCLSKDSVTTEGIVAIIRVESNAGRIGETSTFPATNLQ
jgi:DNA-binding NarL/FixJ family response regulator